MKRSVILHGELGRQFGGPYKLNVRSPAEAAYALGMQIPGFLRVFGEGEYFIHVGSKPLNQWEECTFERSGDIEFFPSVMASGGQKGKSIGIMIAGTVLLGAAVIASGGTAGLAAAAVSGTAGGMALSAAASIGVSLILSGAVGLLSPVPEMQDMSGRQETRKTQSFLYQGPVNREAEGGPVPLIFGEVVVGSIRIGGGVVVTSSISEGREYVDLDDFAIGALVFNFTFPTDTVVRGPGGGNVERFLWERKNKAVTRTKWNWERRVEWYGDTVGSGSLPNETYLVTKYSLRYSDGTDIGGDFNDDYFETHNGVRTATGSFWVDPDVIIRHEVGFELQGQNEDAQIKIKSFYSRFRREA